MNTWNNTTEYPDAGLLPEGAQLLTIFAASEHVNEHTNRSEAVLELAAKGGMLGIVTIPLEPWNTDDDKVVQFERVFKTYASGLDYEPTNPSETISDIASGASFMSYLHELVGRRVSARVEHVLSKTLREDGTPFVNHRVRFRGLDAAQFDTTTAEIDTRDFVPINATGVEATPF